MTDDRDLAALPDPARLRTTDTWAADQRGPVMLPDLRPAPDDEYGDLWLLTIPISEHGSQVTLTLSRNELVDFGLVLGAVVAHGAMSALGVHLEIESDPDTCTIRATTDDGTEILAVLPHPGLAQLTRLIAEAVGQ